MELIAYIILFLITLGFALGVLFSNNTVRSAMSLVGVMLSLAANFLLMRMEFVAFIQIIVYAGAIMVLFLFVIMLLNLREKEAAPWYLQNARIGGGVLAFAFFFLLAWGIQTFTVDYGVPGALLQEQAQQEAQTPGVIVLSTVMITKYILPFILTSVLLLVAVIGAIVMARRTDEDGNDIVLDKESV